MNNKMLKFVEIGQQTPPKREVGTRKEDFNEIYDEFINQKAQFQKQITEFQLPLYHLNTSQY